MSSWAGTRTIFNLGACHTWSVASSSVKETSSQLSDLGERQLEYLLAEQLTATQGTLSCHSVTLLFPGLC